MDFMIFECFKLNDAEGTVLDIEDLLNTADPSKGIHVLGYEADAGLKAPQVLRGAVACCRQADTVHALDNESRFCGADVADPIGVSFVRRATAAKPPVPVVWVDVWDPTVLAASFFVPFWSGGWAARSEVVKRQRDVFRHEKACRACTSKVMVVG